MLAQIDKAIGSVLLLARSGSSKEGGEGSNRERITLLGSTSSKLINEKFKFGVALIKKSKAYTSLLPFGRGIGDVLSDTLCQSNRGGVNVHGKGNQAKEDSGELNHLENFLEYTCKVKEGLKKQNSERELARPETDNAAPGWKKLKKGKRRKKKG